VTIKDTNFWLNESDLKTPIHDEMVLFTFNNCEKIINDFKIEWQIKKYNQEVKSIGTVLRQFQYYKSNLPSSTKLILVTKTSGLKEIFESQGFYVYEYSGRQQTI